MEPDDEKLAMAVYLAIEEKVGNGPASEQLLADLPKPQRSVLLANWAANMISNGAMRRFFEGADDPRQFAQAFDEIGMSAAGDVIRRGLSVFPNGEPILDYRRRLAWFDTFSDDPDEWWEDRDALLNVSDKMFFGIVAKYIRSHWPWFEEFTPKINEP